MQVNSAEHQSLDPSSSILGVVPSLIDAHESMVEDAHRCTNEPTHFHVFYTSCMEMYADAKTVGAYLDGHRDWFRRCAHPMKTEPLGENGYELIIGRFGSFGYEVEPKIGLDLLPQDQGIYRIQTIPLEDQMLGYEVDFQAAMHLVEADINDNASLLNEQDLTNLPPRMTHVEWELDLKVAVHFPRFIHALPKSLIQSTGDRLLLQIVRQVSRCLSHKVQEDFHGIRGIPFPKKRKKSLWNRHSES